MTAAQKRIEKPTAVWVGFWFWVKNNPRTL